MEFEYQGIKCSIFGDAENVIKKAEVKFREARNLMEKQYYSQDILLELESLLSCSDYNSGNPDCISCHSISRRRIKDYEHLVNNETEEYSDR
jgi:hypothetical protein